MIVCVTYNITLFVSNADGVDSLVRRLEGHGCNGTTS